MTRTIEPALRAWLRHYDTCQARGAHALPCPNCRVDVGCDDYCGDARCANYKNGVIAKYVEDCMTAEAELHALLEQGLIERAEYDARFSRLPHLSRGGGPE